MLKLISPSLPTPESAIAVTMGASAGPAVRMVWGEMAPVVTVNVAVGYGDGPFPFQQQPLPAPIASGKLFRLMPPFGLQSVQGFTQDNVILPAWPDLSSPSYGYIWHESAPLGTALAARSPSRISAYSSQLVAGQPLTLAMTAIAIAPEAVDGVQVVDLSGWGLWGQSAHFSPLSVQVEGLLFRPVLGDSPGPGHFTVANGQIVLYHGDGFQVSALARLEITGQWVIDCPPPVAAIATFALGTGLYPERIDYLGQAFLEANDLHGLLPGQFLWDSDLGLLTLVGDLSLASTWVVPPSPQQYRSALGENQY